jgi:neutral ceramidase
MRLLAESVAQGKWIRAHRFGAACSSPIANTVMVTLANGMANSGYIPDDALFGAYTFQVLSSHLKPGCAETAIDCRLMNLILAHDK